SELRDRLTRHIFISNDVNDPTGLLEVTFEKVVAAEQIEKVLDKAVRDGRVQRYHGHDWFAEAVAKNILTEAQADQLREVEELTDRVIAVDHFDPDAVRPNYMEPGHNMRGTQPNLPAAEAAE
ncbi:MAG: acyl-CoA dehydrogenase domain-containing protein, partial [Pseudomonadota bacterium]